ncbi:unnamed protein product [Trichobilharzia regenti]|nr:unnamed protein product [Trichobilharzia regenti]
MVYNYTKPRGPIAAMYSSPGPCYSLPGLVGYASHDPRSNHLRGAQWSFGIRHGKFSDESSPGPCYYPDSKVLRDGKDGTPHYSLYSRQKESMIFSNPGPGAYTPENSDHSVFHKAPAYSLSSRNKEFKTDDVPGSYNVDPMLGRTLFQTPGAGAYNVTDLNLYHEAAPKYSVTGRNQLPTDSTRKPGPGAYHPEKVRLLFLTLSVFVI